MFDCLGKFLRDRRGSPAVEFALVAPLLIIMFAGITEVGRAIYQAAAVEKGLKMGALFLARSELPITAATLQIAENLIKTGTQNSSAPKLVPGWNHIGADIIIAQRTYVIDGNAIPVFALTAEVPFDPIIGQLIPGIEFGTFRIKLSHEQAYIGI